uniref:Uncharacterized protein n=1 Tax=Oryza barthii TaxID=65489 RepID=A0A0D3GUP2_9ORYZ
MATGAILTDKPSKLDCKNLMVSTCRMSKAGIGGLLIDFDGNFVGMNFYDRKETLDVSADIMDNQNRNIDLFNNRWPVPKIRWHYPHFCKPRKLENPDKYEKY